MRGPGGAVARADESLRAQRRLYGPRASRWAMTERGGTRVAATLGALHRASALEWIDDGLTLDIDEVCAPLPRRIRGTIRLQPSALADLSFLMDAPATSMDAVRAVCPYRRAARGAESALSGIAYFDSNCGAEPLEEAFRSWTCRARASPRNGVLYDVAPRSDAPSSEGPAARWLCASATTHRPRPSSCRPSSNCRRRLARCAPDPRDLGYGARSCRRLRMRPSTAARFWTRICWARSLPRSRKSRPGSIQCALVQCLLPFRMPRALA